MSVAFGSSTLVPNSEDVYGSHARVIQYDFQGVNPYSVGYTITPALFGLQVLRRVELVACNVTDRYITYVATGLPGGLSGGSVRVYGNAGEISGDDSASYYRLLGEGE